MCPQAGKYLTFIKKHLVQGNPLAWFIMLHGGCYPVYPGVPYGDYSHVEPVYGIYSDHPLTDDGQVCFRSVSLRLLVFVWFVRLLLS